MDAPSPDWNPTIIVHWSYDSQRLAKYLYNVASTSEDKPEHCKIELEFFRHGEFKLYFVTEYVRDEHGLIPLFLAPSIIR